MCAPGDVTLSRLALTNKLGGFQIYILLLGFEAVLQVTITINTISHTLNYTACNLILEMN